MSALTPRIDRFEKNYIINGAFDFWQRATLANITNATVTYIADRFSHYSNLTSGLLYVMRHSSNLPPNSTSNYSMQIKSSATEASIDATDYSVTVQHIEGYNARELYGKTFTVSFWVWSTVPGTYALWAKNNGSTRSYISEYTIDSALTWEKKTITITHDATGTWDKTNNRGISIGWTLVGGSNYIGSNNTWQDGNKSVTSNMTNTFFNATNNYFYLADVMVNIGEVAGDFHRHGKDIGEELSACQRYYEKSYNLDTALGTQEDDTMQTTTNCPNSTDQLFWEVIFRVIKRGTPVIKNYGRMGTADKWSYYQGGNQDVSVNYYRTSPRKFLNYLSTGVSSECFEFQWTADAEL